MTNENRTEHPQMTDAEIEAEAKSLSKELNIHPQLARRHVEKQLGLISEADKTSSATETLSLKERIRRAVLDSFKTDR